MYSKEKEIQTNPEFLQTLCEKLFYLRKIENLILTCVVVVQLEAASKQYLNAADPSPIEASAFRELIFAFYQIANYFGASYT